MLIKCADCSADVSDKASACPKCGRPVPVNPEEIERAISAASPDIRKAGIAAAVWIVLAFGLPGLFLVFSIVQHVLCERIFGTPDMGLCVNAIRCKLADEISLAGPAARIRDRMQAWKASPVTTILAGTRDPVTLRVLAEAAL